jgi:hypothetical protein
MTADVSQPVHATLRGGELDRLLRGIFLIKYGSSLAILGQVYKLVVHPGEPFIGDLGVGSTITVYDMPSETDTMTRERANVSAPHGYYLPRTPFDMAVGQQGSGLRRPESGQERGGWPSHTCPPAEQKIERSLGGRGGDRRYFLPAQPSLHPGAIASLVFQDPHILRDCSLEASSALAYLTACARLFPPQLP